MIKKTTHLTHHVFCRFFYALGLCLTIAVGLIGFFGRPSQGDFDIVVVLLLFANLALWIPSFIFAIRHPERAHLLRYGLMAILLISLLIMVPLTVGVIQDAMGIVCAGFFGSPGSCLSYAGVSVSIPILYPLVYLPAMIGSLIYFGFALRSDLRQ